MISFSNKKHYCATTVQDHNMTFRFSFPLDSGFVCLFVSKKRVPRLCDPTGPFGKSRPPPPGNTAPPPAGGQQHTRRTGPSRRKFLARGCAPPRPMLAVLLLPHPLVPLLRPPLLGFCQNKKGKPDANRGPLMGNSSPPIKNTQKTFGKNINRTGVDGGKQIINP